MLDYKPTLVTELSSISANLPVMYEMFLDSTTSLPVLTYMEQNNPADKEGGRLRYSYKTYRLKLWGKSLSTLSTYSASLDDKMYSLGFTRTNYNEMLYDDVLCLIFDYRGLALEEISTSNSLPAVE